MGFIPEARECGRVESNHHSQRRRRYSPLSSPVLSVSMCEKGGRPDSNRYREDHDLECCRYTTATTAGTTGLEPAAYRLTSECSCR
jgi:hypothetical protein